MSNQGDADMMPLQSDETVKMSMHVLELFEQLDGKIQGCISRGKETVSEEVIIKMQDMNVTTVYDLKQHLNCLKDQINLVLLSKWNLQKHLLPFIGDQKNVADDSSAKHLIKVGRLDLLFEHVEENVYHLKILDEIEISKNFPVMTKLCKLREKKDTLIQEFRNYMIRIGHQNTEDISVIKNHLSEFQIDIQILSRDYHTLKTQLQYLSVADMKRAAEMLSDFEDLIKSVVGTASEKMRKGVGTVAKKVVKTSKPKSKVYDHEATMFSLREIERNVDETMNSLQSLDETLISKDFAAMRYICELHHEKEQVLSTFEKLLDGMLKLTICSDDDIVKRLTELSTVSQILLKKYEYLGLQLLIFSDIIAIVNNENAKLMNDGAVENVQKVMQTQTRKVTLTSSAHDFFGSEEDLKQYHYILEVSQNKWFPSKNYLPELYREKCRAVSGFQNFLERTPDLDVTNALPVLNQIHDLIRNAETVTRKFQSLRMQLLWIAGDSMLTAEMSESKFSSGQI